MSTAFSDRPHTVAHTIANYLVHLGVHHIWGLTGGHIKPIWDESQRAGIQIVDARHEAAAVHMAQAAADLTGELAVATVTCGAGLTNAITGIATAYADQSPLLVFSALPPSPQLGRGAFEELAQVDLVRPVTRRAVTVWQPQHILAELDAALSAALGDEGPQGPAYIDMPIDVLRAPVPEGALDKARFRPRTRRRVLPAADAIGAAAQALRECRRPLVISGRGALGAEQELAAFLETSGALHLESKEDRGLLPGDHPANVTALRGRASAEADLVVTVGKRLNYELGYGSKAVFQNAEKFIRIGRTAHDVADNRVADVEVFADAAPALAELARAELADPARDDTWLQEMREEHLRRVERFAESAAATPLAEDGRMHPTRMLAELNKHLDDRSIVTLDGGDIFSFARIALRRGRVLDAGALGCIGIAVPFAVAAALVHPERRVVCVTGDGSFGFNGVEVSSAVRHHARVVFVVANNEAWNIERTDQEVNYGGNVFGTELPGCRYDLFAQSLGAHGEHVEDPAELPEAFERAFAGAPAVIDVAVTRTARSPDFASGLADLCDYQPLRTWDDAERRALGLA